MSNQNAEHTIKSRTSSKCKTATLILFQDLQFLCRKKNYNVSTLYWITTNLLPKKLRQFASSCEWRMSLVLLVNVEDRNEEVCRSFHWCLMLRGLGNVADCLKVRPTQPIERQAENRSDICILGINYSFAGHAFVTRNSNQTITRSLLGLGTRLRCMYSGTQCIQTYY